MLNKDSEDPKELVFVCLDFFDTFLEYLPLMTKMSEDYYVFFML